MIRKNAILILALFYTTVSIAQTANFTASVTSGCSPVVVNFQNQSTGNISSYFWDFGNSATSTLKTPSTTYFIPGTYTVKLTVSNAQGSNTQTRTQYITVYGKPGVNFKVNDSSGCFPHRAQFTDLSTTSIGTTNSTWLWDFGDGTQGSGPNPNHTYISSGNYTVTAKVTNDKGCYSVITKQSFIQIAGGVVSSFSNTLPAVCKPPFKIAFSNNSTGPGTLSWTWNFGDGSTSTQPNPLHTYASNGNYSVTLTTKSSDGCIDTLTKTNLLTFQNIQTSIKLPDSLCINTPVNLINNSSPVPVSSNWTFGDGTSSNLINPVKVYNSVGTYTIRLFNTYSYCKDSSSRTIKTLPRPIANFSAPVSSKCQPNLLVNFKDLSSNAVTWQWNFGDGTTSNQQFPAHTYTTYGSFDVKLIVTNASGCTDSIKKVDYIKIIRPVIDIQPTYTQGCVPFNLNPVAVISTLDAVSSYLWNFGDGTTSTLSNPSHIYSSQGNYTLSLTITTSSGCTETISLPGAVKVGRKPILNFSAVPNPVCAFQPVQFKNLTNESDQWFWTFGDGGISSDENPLHEYGDTGVFSVKLYATNNGCSDSLIRTDFIRVKPPISKFGFQTTCLNRLQFNFLDSSIGATSWFWNFGDGTTSNLQNPIHVFPAYNTYNVSLTVSNDTCSHTKTLPIKVFKEVPDITAPFTVFCNPVTFNLSAGGSNTSNIVQYDWDFGDGSQFSSNSATADHAYTNSGPYTILLTVTDIYGCKDTVTKTNFIRVKGPKADFSVSNASGCKNITTIFNDLSQNDGVSQIVSWEWNFGDGTLQTFKAPPFTHTYTTAGTFTVILRITDASGCSHYIGKPDVVITTDPKASFFTSDTLSCPGSTVNFTNNSNALNYTSQWDFGNGTSSALNSPGNIYNATGLYTVKLKVTDQIGCTDSLTRINYIKVDKPVASYTVNDSISSCTPFEVQFTNTSHYYYSQAWEFSTIGTGWIPNPIVFYNVPGIYPIRLVVVSQGLCFDTTYGTIRVYDTVGSKVTYLPLNGCKPLNVGLNTFSPGPMTYTWDFGDGVLTTNDSAAMTHVYNFFGNFVPKVILTDPAGCIIPITGPDTIRIKGATVKFGLDHKFFCDSGMVRFLDSTLYNDSVSVYNWDFGDGSISHLQNPSHYYSSPGNYSVLLNVQTQNACLDTFRLNKVLKIVESPLISVAGDSIICVNELMKHLGIFDRSDTSIVNWDWKFPNGASSSIQNPDLQKYANAGDFVVTAIATNSSGCKDTATKKIHVNPLPSVSMPSTITMQAGFPVLIPATYTSNVTGYTWVPSNTLDCNNCPQPTASPKFNTNYTVSFVDSNGCRNSGIVQVIVICKNANVFVPNTFSPNNDGNNDVFYVRGKGLDRVKSIRIFNRWGEVVFEQSNFPVNNPSFGWDGKFKGNKPLPDVYIYQVEVFCENSQVIHFEGNVALIQ